MKPKQELETEKQKQFSELRNEGLKLVEKLYAKKLNVADFHDALFVLWLDYFKESDLTLLNDFADKLKKKIIKRHNEGELPYITHKELLLVIEQARKEMVK